MTSPHRSTPHDTPGSDKQPALAKLKAGSHKAVAFALMLAVPVALGGCNTTTARDQDCRDYDEDGYCDSNGSRAYVPSSGKTYKDPSSYSSKPSSGFGSSGISKGSGG